MSEASAKQGTGVKQIHPYLSGNFAPIEKTVSLRPCTFTGRVPVDLAGGQYVRNGGNPVANSDKTRDFHWFDGDGMVSGVLFRRRKKPTPRGVGRSASQEDILIPEFVNQYLVTDAYCYSKASGLWVSGRPLLPSIATLVNPLSSIMAIIYHLLRTILLVLLSHMTPRTYPIKKISVANTGLVYHDGRALATCESGPPLRLSLPDLKTIGWFNGKIAQNELIKDGSHGVMGDSFGGSGPLSSMLEWTTAHPRVDPVTKEMIAFHAVFIKPFVFYSIMPPERQKEHSVPPPKLHLPVPGVTKPKMMHDFGVSREHTVIIDIPLSLDPRNLLRGLPVLSYDAAGVSRFGVFPRYRPQEVQWFETSPCVIFHTANCWTSELSPELDISQACVDLLVCRLTSASLVFSAGNLATPALEAIPPEYAEEEQCRLYYYQFRLAGPEREHCIQHQWALSAISFEFPTMSTSHSMEDARYIYGCTTGSGSYTVALGKAAKIDYLAKIDVRTLIARGTAHPPQQVKGCVDARTVQEVSDSCDPDDPIKLFRMPEGWYAQEPRFVPRKDAQLEDDGWLLTYAFDESQLDGDGQCPESATSELWIIDARTMKETVARIHLPQRVPYGLHGAWFSEDEVLGQRPYLGTRQLAPE
ncbi:uncharacterized protein E0L32_009038 [Thyridium curvatum]|uniref:Carotenoid cleavage dioxygenase n=1 Tax=Thyridium curvatum TaxID=1093900 RepID=A0A507AXI5_9PEZI|nr:uncharacterized protein E0L32_009038 [Thyridium curvatum]TPX09699.1 hypothetical protein E0L32_009038 [Thyridium curvatum]